MYLTAQTDLRKIISRKPSFFATDFDGTLVAEALQILPSTVEAYQRAVAGNYQIFLATGRSLAAATSIIKNLGLNEIIHTHPGIYLNGGFVLGPENEVLFESRLEPYLVKSVAKYVNDLNNKLLENYARFLKKFDITNNPNEHGFRSVLDFNLPPSCLDAAIYAGNTIYFPRETQLTDGFKQYNDGNTIYERPLQQLVDDLPVQKMNIISHNRAVINFLIPHIKEIVGDSARVVSSVSSMLEISPANTSKSEGMKILMKHMNLDALDGVALGDANNDIDMLRMFPLSFCMGSSHDDVKKSATYVTQTAADDGWAFAVNAVINTFESNGFTTDTTPFNKSFESEASSST